MGSKKPILVDKDKNRIEFLDTRYYLHESGAWFPSNTTILDAYPKSAYFYEWLKKVGDQADEIRDEAGDKGSTVHQLTEAYDLGAEVCMMSENGHPLYKQIEWSMFERYVNFMERFQPQILDTELHIVSPELGFGGTLDRRLLLTEAFGEHAGKKVIMDIKTSNSLHNHYWLQQAGYVKLYEKIYGEEVDDVCILWLNAKTRTEGKKGAIQGIGWQLVFPEKSIDYYWRLFRATHALWLEENKDYKPRNISYSLTHKKQ